MPFITAQGSEFQLNNQPFAVTGFNCYFLAYCSEESRRAAMMRAKELEASVIRAWAFPSFQNGLQGLDALIQAAEDLHLKLILPLVNHWPDFGGMPAYVNSLAPGCNVHEFYRSSVVRAAYQDWVTQVLTRRNSITGRLYSEEPAILGWELTNEARCPVSGGRELLLDWVYEMAEFVKSLDANHLLALGDEGFFGQYGVDWAANLAVPEIDFGTYHFYPEAWGKRPEFGEKWIQQHREVAANLGKPALLEEFGIRDASKRARWYPKWPGLVWMLGHRGPDTIGYVDDYVIY
jgi:mannan endo-1,4-beta-mannosidase